MSFSFRFLEGDVAMATRLVITKDFLSSGCFFVFPIDIASPIIFSFFRVAQSNIHIFGA
jgi:hypothetical protein